MTSQATIQQLQICRIKFPEIQLQTRNAHKLRGYFGNLFKEHSPLLHNHYEDGRFRYKYPLVQYKVVDQTPMLVGLEEGAQLLTGLFLKIKELKIDDTVYPINSKNIEITQENVGYSSQFHSYTFRTLWMALNQINYAKYKKLSKERERQEMLNSILVGHILNLFRNCDIELRPNERLIAKTNVQERKTNFKEQKMIAFAGDFIVNAKLPSSLGLGKAASRGFGTIHHR